ncbi:TetR/AcrR family transcriptional regulator [Streptomyces sp. Je 1-79]|uniref:TetR/AcrR family transcriptional regulator n=1 Tax=Streptomyces sp. Je 1-79 TaxID=2943847 RepID=UPI0021A4F7DD|nr:TetR/AcrR family transcriptional regulator [Streptomyces sp. Je 1-79]MCT4352234.1 TetR/AcrR family transcriptional regulator [Streptomyces sp. Je 1-79]
MGTASTNSAKPAMRDSLIAAAFQLFLERGYEQTTVDDIVALAGVGRRSFFRYFPSKEDVVFPDHEQSLADMTQFLAASADTDDPLVRVCDATRLVMRMYAENPTFSVQRYRLTREVTGLRTYELSVVWRYEKTLGDYLRTRYADRRDGTLRANVVAAAVVAAHNHTLRHWLRSGGEGDPLAEVDRALDFVRSTWSEGNGDGGAAGSGAARSEEAEDVVVVITKRSTPMWRVVREVESSLGES